MTFAYTIYMIVNIILIHKYYIPIGVSFATGFQIEKNLYETVIVVIKNYEQILAELFPQTFEGGRFLVSKGLSSHFQVSHTLTMSQLSPQDSGYKFGATYIGTKQYSPSEVRNVS